VTGYLYLIAAALLFSVMSLLVKWAGQELPSPVLVLARGVVTAAIGYVWLRRAGLAPLGSRRPLLWWRGIFGWIGLLGYFTALTELPLATATVLHSLNPVLTTAIAAIVLRERVTPGFLGALAASFAGVLWISWPTGPAEGTPLSPLGIAAALVGACGASAAYVSVRKLRETDEPLVIVFYFSMIAVPGALPLLAIDFVMPQGTQWLLLVGIGVVTQGAQVCLTHGLARVPAGPATSVGYLQIVLSIAWGVWLFDEVPARSTLLGALLIVLSTSWTVLRRSPRDAAR